MAAPAARSGAVVSRVRVQRAAGVGGARAASQRPLVAPAAALAPGVPSSSVSRPGLSTPLTPSTMLVRRRLRSLDSGFMACGGEGVGAWATAGRWVAGGRAAALPSGTSRRTQPTA